jgi:predicted DNA repair protein MutK
MLWVGGGILIHGLHELGVHGPEKAVHHAAEAFAALVPAMHAFMNWLAQAGIAAVLGVIVGTVVDPLVNHVLQPLWARFGAKKA